MLSLFPNLLKRLLCAAALACVAVAAQAQTAKPDPNGPPDQLVLIVANQALTALKAGGSTQESDIARINKVVDQYVLPYIDFEKTTRLAAGRYWRQATPQQRTDLRLDWNAANGRWGLGAYVQNLFDKQYVSGLGTISQSVLGTPYAYVTPPRMWGVEARVKF